MRPTTVGQLRAQTLCVVNGDEPQVERTYMSVLVPNTRTHGHTRPQLCRYRSLSSGKCRHTIEWYRQNLGPAVQMRKLLTTTTRDADPASAALVAAQVCHTQDMNDAVYRLQKRRQESSLAVHTFQKALQIANEREQLSVAMGSDAIAQIAVPGVSGVEAPETETPNPSPVTETSNPAMENRNPDTDAQINFDELPHKLQAI